MRLAILNDIHYGPPVEGSQRRCDIAPILLRRAVRRLNELEKPDLTLVLGDLLNDGTLPDATERLTLLKTILGKLQSPYLVIPGNHDGDVEAFYRVFERPKEIEEIGGVKFLSFLDEEQPEYCAKRSPQDIERFRIARSGFKGPIVSLQHTCLFPPERAHAPHNLTNAPAVIRAMKAAGVALSVSGHHHRGVEDLRDGALLFVNAPAFCEFPFIYTMITLDPQGKAETERRALAMPRLLKLIDTHLHTQMAYCSDNMDVETSIQLARDFGLAGLCITEHSGQLYFGREEYWSKACLRSGMSAATPANNRMGQYLAFKAAFGKENVRFGLEADCDYQGNLLIAGGDRAHFDHIVGALHGLPGAPDDPAKAHRVHDDFLFLVEKILQQGVVSLAHPFRVFRRSGLPLPEALFLPTAKLLKQYGVAAELNFHTHLPPVAFVRMCLDLGIKFTLASDAHDLSEIGDFAYHIDLLKQAGFDGDFGDVMLHIP
jgi:histidinol phosphatase-like PHP family hydrolase/predicted phosphodiesterase